MTDQPFGVNFAIGMHGKGYEKMIEVAGEMDVPVVTITGGNPAPIFDILKDASCKNLYSSLRNDRLKKQNSLARMQ